MAGSLGTKTKWITLLTAVVIPILVILLKFFFPQYAHLTKSIPGIGGSSGGFLKNQDLKTKVVGKGFKVKVKTKHHK
jgi:hypothetical protein